MLPMYVHDSASSSKFALIYSILKYQKAHMSCRLFDYRACLLLRFCALFAERLAACSRAPVLNFNVVTGVAVRVIVMNGLLD